MKQKIHIPTLSSRGNEGSHFQIPKLLNFQILLFSIFCSLFSISVWAQQPQPYEWEWAMNGGSSLGGTGANNIDDEQIYDIKVGSDGNYYFIASIFGTGQHNNAQLDGVTVPTNNTPSGPEDIFLFSTDCEGGVRWSQAIGGGSSDRAYNLVLDSEDNVYIGGYFGSGVTNSAGTFPVRFSPTDSLPSSGSQNVVSDYHKKIFLVKYDKDGDYQGKKALQGNVDLFNSGAQILDLAISNDTLHFIVGLQGGTHLDNQVTVPSTVTTQYHLAKYDTDLNYVSSMVLPVADGTAFPAGTSRFVYDESNNTYYIAGKRRGSPLMPLTYDGQAIVNQSFIIAIDGSDGSKKWIREIYTNGGNPTNNITSLIVDEDSNVYIGGKLFRYYNDIVNIYDPAGTYTYPIPFTPDIWTNLFFVTKFDTDGTVEWIKTPTDFAPGSQDNSAQTAKGLAVNGNEVALGTCESNFEWDGLYLDQIPNAQRQNYRGDPTLLRLDKSTGMAVELNTIKGGSTEYEYMTAIAADNDGNYITGGTFTANANLFMNNNLGINPLISTGEADFFVAKLANSECGSGLSTDDFNALSFNVYPNPTTGVINVETTEQLSAFTIYDATGRLIRQSMFDGSNQINLENTSNGVYFIRIVTVEGNAGTVKVVKR
ncbi:T9SS type A sorting domain-containing protein [Flavobacterium dauae]|uniref:T9SS type A sorting domain-containing protein n=1 Tax=Flavobacterium dauae TaxID=1563479 RepID=UPI00101B42D1|nr:T9SS type A sorting domain-containing protein [Flavobacterium dauae]WLD24269.1 T9SS type A sorting domain-containing protein [Flavobacterium dauae]